jgi:hypothetical protein
MVVQEEEGRSQAARTNGVALWEDKNGKQREGASVSERRRRKICKCRPQGVS